MKSKQQCFLNLTKKAPNDVCWCSKPSELADLDLKRYGTLNWSQSACRQQSKAHPRSQKRCCWTVVASTRRRRNPKILRFVNCKKGKIKNKDKEMPSLKLVQLTSFFLVHRQPKGRPNFNVGPDATSRPKMGKN